MQVTENLDQKTFDFNRNLNIFQIQRSCVHDGPGIRTTIFFQGCRLRCPWCQNPEMQSFQSEMSPIKDHSMEQIIKTIMRDKKYYRSTNGGITLSGGEPLLQDPEEIIGLLKLLKKENIKITVETCLHVPWEHIRIIAPYIDLFLVDLKIVGDNDLHLKYLEKDSNLIHENIKKLLKLNAHIKFRMVMVPGFTDSERNIQATSDFLKSINHDSIELLKYHNLYEDKAKRLGLNIKSLNISPDQSLISLKKGIELFRNHGITVKNTDLDAPRHEVVFTERVKKIQNDIRESGRSICLEAISIKTNYYMKHGFDKPTPIHRAECLSHVLQNKKVKIYPQELLVGNFTSKRVAGQFWGEYIGIIGYKMFYKIDRLKPVSFKISIEDIFPLFRIFTFWTNNSLLGRVNPHLLDNLMLLARASEMNAGSTNNVLAIAHFVANFEQILKLGTSGLIEKIRATQKEKLQNKQNFYNGMIIALQGLEAFAKKYAQQLVTLSRREKDPARREELVKMAEICEHIPKYPARTFHEALQSMLFLHIALCIESYENAISFGRLDQILYPYYKKDLEAGRITYEEAKELLALFILKMDENILINDGDTFLELFNLVETLSTDQAVTFGGVDENGNDVTNDITYMLLDICELQPLAADMAARVHEHSPDRYLERIAEIYINGCPIPQLFSDDIYIKTLQQHYSITLEQARNYSIVGCVEPTASDEHFGNTDCANMNLALPLLQAMKGLKYDLWNFSFYDQLLKLTTNYFKYVFKRSKFLSGFVNDICDGILKQRDLQKGLYKYNPPSNINELLERFQFRLNELAKSILTDHQHFERELRRNFTTPLASSLFNGCIKSGKDVYEGGTKFNSSGIQAVGVIDVADSLHAINEVVYKKELYSIDDIINAVDANFQGDENQRIRSELLAVPKFGDDSSPEAINWVNRVMEIYNNTLESINNCPRNGRYAAGYYALNVGTRYGKNTPALPSGRLKGVSLANSIIPHYGMEKSDLLSSLNSISKVNFIDHAENGATATLTIDSALFQGPDGVKNLANIFRTFLTTGGMQLQPNVLNRQMLIDAYHHPEKYKYLIVRIAGYCSYFNELSDEMKLTLINRTCYS